MALDLVSNTYTPDPGEGPPSSPPIHDFTPLLDLTKSMISHQVSLSKL